MKKFFLSLIALMMVGMQATWAQGYRVNMSDGTVAQFSTKTTKSIDFYNGSEGDADINFNPFTPVNQCIVGTWYKSKSETVTFNRNGTTDYIEESTYKFFPYQGHIIIYNASGAPVNILKVYELTEEKMIIGAVGDSRFKVWGTTPQPQLVEEILLSETSLNLQPDDVHTLTATVLPEDADNKEVTWESSNEEVAEVTKKGKVNANAEGSCVITCRATDGSGVYAVCHVTVGGTIVPTEYEWVDLGLPSGTLWATCNVGANRPEEYGDYFAWGETEPKTDYSWSTYKYCKSVGSNILVTKYCTDISYGYDGFTDGKEEPDPEDDAATANWGSEWQMPSLDQFTELNKDDYTTRSWKTLNGVYGLVVTSKTNGKWIFFPAAGYFDGTSCTGTEDHGYYWTRRSMNLSALVCVPAPYNSGVGFGAAGLQRSRGLSVRPVRVPITR